MYKLLTIILLLTLTGCFEPGLVTVPIRDTDFYLESNKNFPMLTNGKIVLPMLKNEHIYSQWYVDGNEAIKFNRDNTFIQKSITGTTYTGTFEWLHTNIVILYVTHYNNTLLDEPFIQAMSFINIDNCEYYVTILMFDIEFESILDRCYSMNPA